MTLEDKIKRCKADRDKRIARIAEDKATVAALNKQIHSLEALEIQNILNECQMPLDEVKALIRQSRGRKEEEES